MNESPWTWKKIAGVLVGVGFVILMWWALRPADVADPKDESAATAPVISSTQPPALVNPWGVEFPASHEDLVDAAQVAAAFVKTVGTYSADTNPQAWRADVLELFPPYDMDERYLTAEPDWELVRSEGISVSTEVTGMEVLSVSRRSIVMNVTASTTPGGRTQTAVTLVPVPGGWAVDGVAVNAGGESGIGA